MKCYEVKVGVPIAQEAKHIICLTEDYSCSRLIILPKDTESEVAPDVFISVNL